MNEMFDPLRVKPILEQTLASVLAEMAFLDCVPATLVSPQQVADLSHCVAIDVLKPGSFRIEIRVGDVFRKKIISMLFDPEADAEPGLGSDASEEDLLLEILNVLAGNFISQYFGADASAKLELPRYLYFTDPAEGEIVAETIMDSEGELIKVALRSVRYRY
jgi:hypothetical protein